MYFSTSFSEIKATPLHCQIPLSMIMRNTWLTLALHVPDLFHSCFRVMSFRSTDVILLGPVCKLRKIFTMRNRLAQSFTEVKPNEEWLPAEHMFAVGVEASIQVIDTEKLQNIMGTTLNVEGKQDAAPALLSARKLCSNRADRHVHVAFGSRMPLPLSTVQINTNLPHDVKLASTNEHTQSLPTSTLRSRIGTSGPSSSTEELWVVHEEEDVNDSVPGVPKGHGGFQKSGTLLSAPANSVSNAHAATTQSSKLSPVYSSSVPKLGLSTQETNYAASTEQMRPVLSNLQCSLLPSKSQISNLKECPASSSATADKELELLYDPILDCYYDPKTNRYYELK